MHCAVCCTYTVYSILCLSLSFSINMSHTLSIYLSLTHTHLLTHYFSLSHSLTLSFFFPRFHTTERPVASLLRGFSAPVNMKYQQSDEDLATIMVSWWLLLALFITLKWRFLLSTYLSLSHTHTYARTPPPSLPSTHTHILTTSYHTTLKSQAHDTDSFNRWDAGNRLGCALLLKLVDMPTVADIEATKLPTHYVDAIRSVLTSCTVRFKGRGELKLLFCLF